MRLSKPGGAAGRPRLIDWLGMLLKLSRIELDGRPMNPIGAERNCWRPAGSAIGFIDEGIVGLENVSINWKSIGYFLD